MLYSKDKVLYTRIKKSGKILSIFEPMKSITFITGNQKKVEYLRKYLGIPLEHRKIDLDEIQSLDLREIVEHKVKQVYESIRSPVLVEDVSLVFEDWGNLP